MTTPRKENPQPGGRPPIYNKAIHPKKVRALVEHGMTEPQIAEHFDVTLSCIEKWKVDHPEFLREMKKGRELPVTMSRSLYKRAMGYKYKEVKVEISPPVEVEQSVPDPNDPNKFMIMKVMVPAREVSRTETVKHLPPDTNALKFVLTNRGKEQWRESSHLDMTSAGDKLGKEMDLSLLTDEEVAILAALERKAKGL